MTEDNNNSNNKYFCLRCKDRNWLIECADGCGQVLSRTDKKFRPRKYLYGHYQRQLIGELNPQWKYGRTINVDGYGLLSGFKDHPNSDKCGRILEHVYNLTQYHKCCMLKWGVVHHIIPIDKGGSNLPFNLQGMTNKQHQLLHHEIDMSDRRCSDPKCKDPDHPAIRKETGKPRWNYIDGKLVCSRCFSRNRRKKN